jgi:ubiquitin-like modifier-activating enzyme 5
VSRYLGYNALKDFFPTMALQPNLECTNAVCRKQQAAYQQRITSPAFLAATAAAAAVAAEKAAEEAAKPLHDDNEWCISVDADADEVSGARALCAGRCEGDALGASEGDSLGACEGWAVR